MLITYRFINSIRNYNYNKCIYFNNIFKYINTISNIDIQHDLKKCYKALSKNDLINIHKSLENISYEHIIQDPNLVSKLAIISIKKKIFSKPFFEIINHYSDLIIPKLSTKNLSLLLSSILKTYNKYDSDYTLSNKHEKLILESAKYFNESSKNNFITFTPLDLSQTLTCLIKFNAHKYTNFNIENGLNHWLSNLKFENFPPNTRQIHHFAMIGLYISKLTKSPKIFINIIKHIKVKEITPSIAIILLASMYKHNYKSEGLSNLLITLALNNTLWTREIVWLIKLINLNHSSINTTHMNTIIDILKGHYEWMNLNQLSSVALSLHHISTRFDAPNILKEMEAISGLLYEKLGKASHLNEKTALNLLSLISNGDDKLSRIARFIDKNYNKLIPYTKNVIINAVTNPRLSNTVYDMRTELISRMDEFTPMELLDVIENTLLFDEFVECIQHHIYSNYKDKIKILTRLLSTIPRFYIEIPDLNHVTSTLTPTSMVHLCIGIIMNINLIDYIYIVNDIINYCIHLPINKFYNVNSNVIYRGYSIPLGLPDNIHLLILLTYHYCINKVMEYDFKVVNEGISDCKCSNYNGFIDEIAVDITECLSKLSDRTLNLKCRHDIFNIDIILE